MIPSTSQTFHHINRRILSTTSSSSSQPSSSPSENDWFPFQNAAEFNLNIAVALIFLVCFVIGALALNAILRCLNNNNYPNRNSSSSTTSTSTAHVQKLNQMSMGPTLVFSTGIKIAGADHAECAICLSEFVEGEGVRVLPRCKHGFHVKCIESWLSSKTSCPTCRTSCLKNNPEKNTNPVVEALDVESGNHTTNPPPIAPPLPEENQQQQHRQQHRQQEEEQPQQPEQQQQQS